MKRLIITLILFLFLITSAFATTVSLIWDNNTESDLAGYNVYMSTSMLQPFNKIGTCAINAYTAADIPQEPNSSLFFAVTAFNTSNLESSYSNIVAVDRFSPSKPAPFLVWE
jgi:fibronectin type 3 domain-containing protein